MARLALKSRAAYNLRRRRLRRTHRNRITRLRNQLHVERKERIREFQNVADKVVNDAITSNEVAKDSQWILVALQKHARLTCRQLTDIGVIASHIPKRIKNKWNYVDHRIVNLCYKDLITVEKATGDVVNIAGVGSSYVWETAQPTRYRIYLGDYEYDIT